MSISNKTLGAGKGIFYRFQIIEQLGKSKKQNILTFQVSDSGFEIRKKNHCDGDIFEHKA